MKIWFLKLFGYNYKICAIQTRYPSEFYRCGIIKLKIDDERDITTLMRPPIFSYWDREKVQTYYSKKRISLNQHVIVSSERVFYNKAKILELIEN